VRSSIVRQGKANGDTQQSLEARPVRGLLRFTRARERGGPERAQPAERERQLSIVLRRIGARAGGGLTREISRGDDRHRIQNRYRSGPPPRGSDERPGRGRDRADGPGTRQGQEDADSSPGRATHSARLRWHNGCEVRAARLLRGQEQPRYPSCPSRCPKTISPRQCRR
jgi:hypothetical protein